MCFCFIKMPIEWLLVKSFKIDFGQPNSDIFGWFVDFMMEQCHSRCLENC